MIKNTFLLKNKKEVKNREKIVFFSDSQCLQVGMWLGIIQEIAGETILPLQKVLVSQEIAPMIKRQIINEFYNILTQLPLVLSEHYTIVPIAGNMNRFRILVNNTTVAEGEIAKYNYLPTITINYPGEKSSYEISQENGQYVIHQYKFEIYSYPKKEDNTVVISSLFLPPFISRLEIKTNAEKIALFIKMPKKYNTEDVIDIKKLQATLLDINWKELKLTEILSMVYGVFNDACIANIGEFSGLEFRITRGDDFMSLHLVYGNMVRLLWQNARKKIEIYGNKTIYQDGADILSWDNDDTIDTNIASEKQKEANNIRRLVYKLINN